MSRMYEMHVEITRFDASKLEAIIKACCGEWSFEADDFELVKAIPEAGEVDDKVWAEAAGSLCGGETEEEFVSRLTTAIWGANKASCDITVDAVSLECLPHELYERGEDDYAEFKAKSAETT